MRYQVKKCEICDNEIKIRIVDQGKNIGEIYSVDKKRRFCSLDCQIEWQKKIKWEDRVGKEAADRIRKETSERVSGDNNPTHNPVIAKKVSESVKKFLENNPRIGEKNSFYNKKHTEEYKKWASESRKGKLSYDENGYLKQKENAKKGKDHHNWKGGISYEPYSPDFNKNIKKLIKERDNYTCCICNKKTQKIAVHHIDYIKEHSGENNLISLCYNCHSKTNFNRENWKLFLENVIKEKYDNLTHIENGTVIDKI